MKGWYGDAEKRERIPELVLHVTIGNGRRRGTARKLGAASASSVEQRERRREEGEKKK